jgi:RNA polymerase sigma-70 factor (ECF subfamily)
VSEKSNIRLLMQGRQNEEAILEGIRLGRDGAFDALYRLYAAMVYRLAVHALRDEGIAQQVLQETFLQVFRKIHTFRGKSALGTWIYRIAMNVILNEHRRTGRSRLVYTSGEDLPDAADEGPSTAIEDEAGRREILDAMYRLIDGLDPKKRLTFLLHYVEELTADEIADIMHEGRGTILKRLQRTRMELTEKAARAGMGEPFDAASGSTGGKK